MQQFAQSKSASGIGNMTVMLRMCVWTVSATDILGNTVTNSSPSFNYKGGDVRL